MGKNLTAVVYLLVMIVLIVAVDLLFLRDHMVWGLAANIVIVAIFAGAHMKFGKRSYPVAEPGVGSMSGTGTQSSLGCDNRIGPLLATLDG